MFEMFEMFEPIPIDETWLSKWWWNGTFGSDGRFISSPRYRVRQAWEKLTKLFKGEQQ